MCWSMDDGNKKNDEDDTADDVRAMTIVLRTFLTSNISKSYIMTLPHPQGVWCQWSVRNP